jgi:hypothetical protein
MMATALTPHWAGGGGVLVSLIAAAAFWPLCGAIGVPLALPRYVNAQSWSDVQDRVIALRVRVDSVPAAEQSGPAWLEVTRHVAHLESEIARSYGRPALRWATRSAYLELWSRIHRAEEALIALVPPLELEAMFVREQMRLEGVGDVSPVLAGVVENVGRWLAGLSGRGPQEPSIQEPPVPSAPLPPITDLQRARDGLREVAHVINRFREYNSAGLVHLRA